MLKLLLFSGVVFSNLFRKNIDDTSNVLKDTN